MKKKREPAYKRPQKREKRIVAYFPAYLYDWVDDFTKLNFKPKCSRSLALVLIVRDALNRSIDAAKRRRPFVLRVEDPTSAAPERKSRRER